LFSTITGTDHFFDIASPISRVTTSVGPPAVKGTMNRTLFEGNLLSAEAHESHGAPNEAPIVVARPAMTCLRRNMDNPVKVRPARKRRSHALFAQPYGCHDTYIKQMFVCGAA
jgi:hypothetical protein